MSNEKAPGDAKASSSRAPRRAVSEEEMRHWRNFFAMQELLRGRIEQQLQADNGLSNADYTVLVALSEAPEGRARAFELGRGLGWEKSRLHHQLTRMSKRGLVEREAGPSRAMYVGITPEGRSALRRAAPGHTREIRRLVLDRITPKQLAQLGEISAVLLEGLQNEVTPNA
ncbi:MarR family winged helix-turn-helix transcriptional regulator [Streptomyces sp. NPDC001250]|uniref:MarR family winged helix-turn-helix transcriptional regulator n=1 Tax=unclassified Streptomyces TaxID=2593676 RepID=UPI0033227254